TTQDVPTLDSKSSDIKWDLISPDPDSVSFQVDAGSTKAIRLETTRGASAPPYVNEYQIVAASLVAAGTAGLRGQFVRLDLPGDSSLFPRHPQDKDKKTINLAELQVFHGEQNIALRKKARQSSGGRESRLAPENALDGNTVGNDQGNPYAHTD